MQIINDNMSIGNIKLPQITDNTLGIVFSFIEKNLFERKDKTLIDLLYRATRYEGIKGLARYNDLHH